MDFPILNFISNLLLTICFLYIASSLAYNGLKKGMAVLKDKNTTKSMFRELIFEFICNSILYLACVSFLIYMWYANGFTTVLISIIKGLISY